jgi:hypothetical protein
LDLNLRKKLVSAKFGAQLCVVLKFGHFGKYDHKYVDSSEMCWGKMEKISLTNTVKNEEVLQSQ